MDTLCEMKPFLDLARLCTPPGGLTSKQYVSFLTSSRWKSERFKRPGPDPGVASGTDISRLLKFENTTTLQMFGGVQTFRVLKQCFETSEF